MLEALLTTRIEWRRAGMVTRVSRSTLAGLEAKQDVYKAELMQIDREIQNEKEALARIEAQIRSLEKESRQAA
jgi:hypothetical protein